MALETERRYFDSMRADLLRHNKEQFAVVKGERLLGAFTSWDQAFDAGVKEFGLAAFLIKQILPEDEVAYFPSLAVNMINARS